MSSGIRPSRSSSSSSRPARLAAPSRLTHWWAVAKATRWPRRAACDPERDREVRLAGARWSQEDDVLGLGQEVELGEVGDDLALDARLDREVEVVERLCRREAGGLHPGRPAVAVARADLLGEDRREIRLVVPALVAGPGGKPRRRRP